MKFPIAIFLLVAPLSLGHGSAGTEGASFLDIPIGSRPAALGSAYTARATDAYAPVWNPAGLGLVEGLKLSATHLNYLHGVHYEYVGWAYRGWGASVQYLGSGDILAADDQGNLTGTFSSSFAAYSLAYGRSLGDRLSLGATGKFIRESIADASATAFAGDVGSLLRVNERVTLGAVIANVGTPVKFVNQRDPLPTAYRAGARVQLRPYLDVSADVVYRRTELFSVSGGVEWECSDALVLRGGLDNSRTRGVGPAVNVSAGVGIRGFGHELAYAWVPYSGLGHAHYLSIDFKFGGRRPDQKSGLVMLEPGQRQNEIGAPSGEYYLLDELLAEHEKQKT